MRVSSLAPRRWLSAAILKLMGNGPQRNLVSRRWVGQVCLLALLVAGGPAALSAERTWTDKSGQYQIGADLMAFGEGLVVLKTSNGELLSMAVSDLSAADQEFLKSKEAVSVHESVGPQKWTLINGMQVIGQVVSHEVKDVVIQRRRGSLYVNDRLLNNLPEVYKKMIPAVVGHFENEKFADLKSMEQWFISRYGARPAKYHCEGVRLALENRDEYAVPYFLFDATDRKFLETGGAEFRETQAEWEEREKQELYMQVRAAEYHRARESQERAVEQQQRQADLQIKQVQLGLLAVTAGVTDLWEVELIPRGGSIFQSQMVVVPARDSFQASQMALSKWPGYAVGTVRRVNRR